MSQAIEKTVSTGVIHKNWGGLLLRLIYVIEIKKNFVVQNIPRLVFQRSPSEVPVFRGPCAAPRSKTRHTSGPVKRSVKNVFQQLSGFAVRVETPFACLVIHRKLCNALDNCITMAEHPGVQKNSMTIPRAAPAFVPPCRCADLPGAVLPACRQGKSCTQG